MARIGCKSIAARQSRHSGFVLQARRTANVSCEWAPAVGPSSVAREGVEERHVERLEIPTVSGRHRQPVKDRRGTSRVPSARLSTMVVSRTPASLHQWRRIDGSISRMLWQSAVSTNETEGRRAVINLQH